MGNVTFYKNLNFHHLSKKLKDLATYGLDLYGYMLSRSLKAPVHPVALQAWRHSHRPASPLPHQVAWSPKSRPAPLFLSSKHWASAGIMATQNKEEFSSFLRARGGHVTKFLPSYLMPNYLTSTEFYAQLLGNVFKRMRHVLSPLSPSAGWNSNVIAGTPTDILGHEVNLGRGEQCSRGAWVPGSEDLPCQPRAFTSERTKLLSYCWGISVT